MKSIIRIFIVSFSVLTLVSCGGGGGESAHFNYAVDRSSAIRIIGGEPLNLTSDEIKNSVQSRLNAADTLLLTNLQGINTVDLDSSCSGTICTFRGGSTSIFDIEIGDEKFQSVMTRNDIPLGEGIFSDNRNGVSLDSSAYGGWMDYGIFFIIGEQAIWSENGQTVGLGYIYGTSIGDAAGSNPTSGTATWTGVMVGADTNLLNLLQGDAHATVDFGQSNIDILFDNIFNLDTGSSRSDIRWDDISLTNGRFSSSTNREIDGSFYGANHQEVGGVFEYGNSVGAFGAKRD